MTQRQRSILPPLAPRDLLEVADELNSRNSTGFLRSAGDRAYYAAFLHTRDQLDLKNYVHFHRGSSVHAQVVHSLTFIHRRTGELLRRLRSARNTLTYETRQVTLPRGQDISWMMESARRIIEFVDALPARP